MIGCSLPLAYYAWGQICLHEFYSVCTLITMHSYLSAFVWWWPRACRHTSHKWFRPLWRFLGRLFRDPDSCRGIWLNPAILPGSGLCQDWGWLEWALPHTTEGAPAMGTHPHTPNIHRNTDKHRHRNRTHSCIYSCSTDCRWPTLICNWTTTLWLHGCRRSL